MLVGHGTVVWWRSLRKGMKRNGDEFNCEFILLMLDGMIFSLTNQMRCMNALRLHHFQPMRARLLVMLSFFLCIYFYYFIIFIIFIIFNFCISA